MLTVEAAAATHIGRVRATNQDSFGFDDQLGLYLVCDGMGGAAGGEIASRLAVETFLAIARRELHSCADTRIVLQRAAAAANRAVVERGRWEMQYRGMGSTLVAARLCGDKLTVINVGDSRAYLFRNGHATQITRDHSLVAERVRAGLMTQAEADSSAMQSVITRAIGAEADVIPDVYELTFHPGDTLLLASDGLTRHIQPQELAEVLTQTESRPAEQACDELIALANRHGGSDNITCVLLRVPSS